MVFLINEQNPQKRLIDKARDILDSGGVIVYPTDTVYALGCDLKNKNAIERIYRIKKIGHNKPLSFIFPEISWISEYVKNMSDNAFKIMKKTLPGPYTFIFQASKLIPKIALTNQKTIGVRIPDNNVSLELTRALGRPIISASVNTLEGEYIIEPDNLEKHIANEVDLIINSGPKVSEPSTVIDFSGDEPIIIREGKGKINF
jgi:tRNA threonylcarbamoyl adenosine modification protein (Sua5/YciO/YrdC/YwlC family)